MHLQIIENLKYCWVFNEKSELVNCWVLGLLGAASFSYKLYDYPFSHSAYESHSKDDATVVSCKLLRNHSRGPQCVREFLKAMLVQITLSHISRTLAEYLFIAEYAQGSCISPETPEVSS